MNYNNLKFRPVKNSQNGETTSETLFLYRQQGNILTSSYHGGQIKQGHLIGIVDDNGAIDMRYHQVNMNGELMTGRCLSKPELTQDGKILLHESWQWTSGDLSSGSSILEQVD